MKVYLVCKDLGTDVAGMAVSEEGVLLASHVSSNRSWANHDLVNFYLQKREDYKSLEIVNLLRTPPEEWPEFLRPKEEKKEETKEEENPLEMTAKRLMDYFYMEWRGMGGSKEHYINENYTMTSSDGQDNTIELAHYYNCMEEIANDSRFFDKLAFLMGNHAIGLYFKHRAKLVMKGKSNTIGILRHS